MLRTLFFDNNNDEKNSTNRKKKCVHKTITELLFFPYEINLLIFLNRYEYFQMFFYNFNILVFDFFKPIFTQPVTQSPQNSFKSNVKTYLNFITFYKKKFNGLLLIKEKVFDYLFNF